MTAMVLPGEAQAWRRWGASLAIVLTAHALPLLIMVWWLGPSTSSAPPSAMPSAVLVDMAPIPAASQAPPTEVPPAQRQQRAVEPEKPVLQHQPKLPEVARAAVSLPSAAPAPPRSEARPPVQETAAPPAASAPPTKASAPGSSASAPSNTAPTWQGLLLGRLEQFKRYPALAQTRDQQGVAYLRFVMDRNGKVLSAKIEKSSGFDLLDSETLALIHRAEPLPKPPPEVAGETLELVVPIEFFINARR